MGFVTVFLFPFHNSLASACRAGLTKPPRSAQSPAGLLTAQVCHVCSDQQYSWAQQQAPALGKYFYSFSLIALDGRRVRWVWEAGRGKKICMCKGEENRDGWRDLSLASVVQASKGSFCWDSASTLKLEWIWGGISIGSEGGGRFRQTTCNGLGSASLLF